MGWRIFFSPFFIFLKPWVINFPAIRHIFSHIGLADRNGLESERFSRYVVTGLTGIGVGVKENFCISA